MKRWRRVVLALLAAAVAGTGAQQYVRREFVAVAPGVVRGVAPMITVDAGGPPDREGFLVTTIYATVPSPGQALTAPWRRELALVRRSTFTLPGETLDEYHDRAQLVMRESQGQAVVAALNYLGYGAFLAGEGALVAHVLPDGPLAGRLQAGEAIVAVDGLPVWLAADLAAAAAALRPGVEVPLRVEDAAGHAREVRFRPLVAGSPEAVLGLSVVTRALRVETPVAVRIEAGEIGGPSAGLVFALEIVDRLLPEDLTGGRRVAATGTVNEAGRVGPVGGVPFKVWAAEREGIEFFLVPVAQREEALRAARRIRVVAVASLEEAVDWLRESR